MVEKIARRIIAAGRARRRLIPLAMVALTLLYGGAAIAGGIRSLPGRARTLYRRLRDWACVRRVTASVLAVCMVFTLAPVNALAAGGDDGESAVIITSFEPLEETVLRQSVPAGAGLDALMLPDTLKAFSQSATLGDSDDYTVGESGGAQGETVTIEGVTWESRPDYDGETPDDYTFRAVLPYGYVLARGARLPKIAVTVGESAADADEEAVRAVEALIEALPSAEDFLALMERAPASTDEGYEDWQAELNAQKEAIGRAKTAYDALSDAQKEMLAPELEKKLYDLVAALQAGMMRSGTGKPYDTTQYNEDDVNVINAIIDGHGLMAYGSVPLVRDDPENWTQQVPYSAGTIVIWDSSTPKRIKKLDLSNQGLGSLPDLSKLTELTDLDCHANQLTELPDLSSLTGLTRLYCYNNKLTGLPNLSNLKSLTHLDCASNKLTGLPDLGDLTSLTYLYCDDNQLDELPSLSNLTGLSELHCYNNQLNELPSLSGLTSLTDLRCNSNQLTGLPDLSGLTSLESLDCSSNKLTTGLPDLSGLTSLKSLVCSSNQLDELPDISGLTSLIGLNCSSNQLTELPDISDLTSLIYLDCNKNLLTELPDLSNLTSLDELDCESNKLETVDVSALPDSLWLFCKDNPIVTLKLPQGKKLTVGHAENGTVMLTDYEDGEATLTATPADNYQFTKWVKSSGGGTADLTGNPVTFTIDGEMTVTPVYELPTYDTTQYSETDVNVINKIISEQGLRAKGSVPLKWNNPENWSADVPIGVNAGKIVTWSDSTPRRIIKLNINSQNLTGALDLSALTELTELSCAANQLTGLPNLNNLTNLTHLNCYHNLLTELPNLGNLRKLTSLACPQNQLTELPGLEHLTELTELVCSSNQLTELPGLEHLTELTKLVCSSNQLTELPGLERLTNLTDLYCENNQLTELPGVGGLIKLIALQCNNNRLTELDASALSDLQSLSFKGNPINTLKLPTGAALTVEKTGRGTVMLTDYTNTTHSMTLTATPADNYRFKKWVKSSGEGTADVTDNSITFTLDGEITVTPVYEPTAYNPAQYSETDVDVINRIISEQGLMASGSVPLVTGDPENWGKRVPVGAGYIVTWDSSSPKRIKGLNLSSQKLDSLPDLSSLTKLTRLDCHTNQLTELPDLSALTGLTELDCSYNALTELPDLSNLTSLTYLDCRGNQLTRLPDLSSLTSLESLSCSSNKLDELPDLSDLTSLTYLDCNTNQLTGLPDLSSLTGLESLDCSDNRLTGLPDLSDLTSLAYLDCYSNQLAKLPDLSKLTSLESLDCSSNRLTELPDLSKLTSLTALVCSDNQLTKLPDLSDLTGLGVLDCSSNRLTRLPDLSDLTGLESLDCSSNQLTELPDLSNLTSLEGLGCSSNLLTELPDLSNLTSLEGLGCESNKLETVDVSALSDNLWLICKDNPIVTLKLPQGKKLTVGRAANGTVMLTGYEDGEATLTATAQGNYHFKKWVKSSGGSTADLTDNPVTFTIDGEMTFTPVYELDPTRPVTYAVKVNGGSGSGSFAAGARVRIDAGTKDGYRFDGWTASPPVAFVNAGSASTTFLMPAADVTVTAHWTLNGSGGSSSGGGSSPGTSSSSGGKSGSGGSYVPPAVTKKPAGSTGASTKAQTKLNADVSRAGVATVDLSNGTVGALLERAAAQAKKNGSKASGVPLQINVSTGNQNVSTISVYLPKSVQERIIGRRVPELTLAVDRPNIVLSLDLESVKSINRQAKADVQITAARINGGALSAEARKAVGNRPAFRLSATYDGGKKSMMSLGGGSMTVEIPYTLRPGEDPGRVLAVLVGTGGDVHYIANSVYDAKTGRLRVKTNRLAVWGVGYKAAQGFGDVSGHWARDDIEFVAARGLLTGAEGAFSPDEVMTRAMLVTALGRLYGVDAGSYQAKTFSDVKKDAPYAPYVEWAVQKDIMAGVGGGSFAPQRAVTRQELALFLQRYAEATGDYLPAIHKAVTFADDESIGAWAREAVSAMQRAGVLAYKDGDRFGPTEPVTRAQAAEILRRYVELSANPNPVQGGEENSGVRAQEPSGRYPGGERAVGSESKSSGSEGVSVKNDAALPERKKYLLHVVKQDDTLWALAERYGCTVAEIIALNQELIVDPNLILVGWELKIPQK